MAWKTIVDDGESLIEVNENGFILRHGSAEHTHHEFYKNYNPQAVTKWHRALRLNCLRKCESADRQRNSTVL